MLIRGNGESVLSNSSINLDGSINAPDPDSKPSVVEAALVARPVVDAEAVNDSSSVNESEVVETVSVISEESIIFEPEIVGETGTPSEHSWPFLILDFGLIRIRRLFGLASLVFILAVGVSIPLFQFLVFGYLIEAKGRIAKTGKFWDGLFGLDRVSRLGSLALGTWLLLWPIRIVSGLWYEAQLIDPTSGQSTGLRVIQIILAIAISAHILAAWFCGGKLRYFFWPLVAPFSMAIWLARKIAGTEAFRPLLDALVGWISPHFVDDLCNVKTITDWFLPAILLKNIFKGTIYTEARDGAWDFVMSLRLKYYFWLGFRGFIGSAMWLFGPTVFLIAATMLQDAAAIVCGLIGVFLSTIVYLFVPFLQAHFAAEKRFMCFFELGAIYQAFRRSPMLHWFALFMTFVLALPLFLLKIETIPGELMWLLSVVFILFTLPAHLLIGWAYGRGRNREKKSWRIYSYPILLLFPPLSLTFTVIYFFTRYTSWNGAWSLFEHHAFLFPVPFWLI